MAVLVIETTRKILPQLSDNCLVYLVSINENGIDIPFLGRDALRKRTGKAAYPGARIEKANIACCPRKKRCHEIRDMPRSEILAKFLLDRKWRFIGMRNSPLFHLLSEGPHVG